MSENEELENAPVSAADTETIPEETTEVQQEKHIEKPLNISSVLDFDFDDLEMDDDTFLKMSENTIQKIKEDELVNGKIASITKDEIYVDIGFKSLGVIPRAELLNAEILQVGDTIDVFIEKMEDPNGKLILSRRRADFMRIWEDIIKLFEKQEVISVRILRRIKGGMVVDLLGIEAFLPGSQIDVRPVRDFDSWVSKPIDVRVVKVNHPSENVVVSHKVLLEEQLTEQRFAIVSTLEKGLVLEGTVKAISDFGVFVDLGGVDGLVHITDLSWGRVTHPSEIVKLDQIVKIVVLDFDEDKKRISLGMKQLTPHPWDTIGEKYDTNTKVRGKVVSLTDYGAFIEIEKGIEGLIHISEMSWTQHIKHPSQMVSMGQIVDATVLNIDKDDKKLALGMKQLEPDPWSDLMQKYPVNSKHKGIVRNLTNFGVFIELEPGVDGLIHISDLSWTKKIRHPGEFVKKGDDIEVLVLSIDPEQRRIALGHKQIKDNPWDYFQDKYKVGSETESKIERIIEKGVIVELPDSVDGFVPVSQLAFAPVRNISEFFNIGDKLPLKVVEFDKEAKKIVLSVVECLRDKDQATIDAYHALHPVPNSDKFASDPTLLQTEGLIAKEEHFDFPDFEEIAYEAKKAKEAKEAKESKAEVAAAAEKEAAVAPVEEKAVPVVEESAPVVEAPVAEATPAVPEEKPVVVKEKKVKAKAETTEADSEEKPAVVKEKKPRAKKEAAVEAAPETTEAHVADAVVEDTPAPAEKAE